MANLKEDKDIKIWENIIKQNKGWEPFKVEQWNFFSISNKNATVSPSAISALK
ncbi:MAG: hypothetical protein H0U49_10350, partial [Parachlamydiaceae bacterium]|nr:hypothetical protein [Parachlamydiaceae bacterium]